jgi:3-oxoacyl-[acyl-carrier-protein] synthase III
MRRSVFTGTGCAIPERTVPNEAFRRNAFFADYGQPLGPADSARAVDRVADISEIRERRYAAPDQAASDLAIIAARRALAQADVDPETLDYLVVAHNFGDVRAPGYRVDTVPTLAARVKQALSISNSKCVAYDLPFGCAGWLQAVIQIDYFLRSGDAKRALVVGAETLSRVCDPHDRDSMLYADGAGAAVLEAVEGDGCGILSHSSRSDALDHACLLKMDRSYDPCYEDPDRLFLKMRGRKLYEYAVRTVPVVVTECLDAAGIAVEDVSRFLVHQANAKLDKAILRRLVAEDADCESLGELMPLIVSWLGNNSVATVPTLLDLVVRGELDMTPPSAGDVFVLTAVGAGMNANAITYRFPNGA